MDKPLFTINGMDYSDLLSTDADTKADSLDGYGGSEEFVQAAKERTEALRKLRNHPSQNKTPEA